MRAKNMQSLTDATKRRHPGVVVYGVGDDAHKLRVSDHNEDDTAGSKAAQSDADSVPEHRAIDIMLGANFTRAQAYALIADLLADPAALKRLKYIIFDGWIWSRSNGWKKAEFTGADKHRDHPHISGDAADDENAAGWPAVEGDDMDAKQSQKLDDIHYALFKNSGAGRPAGSLMGELDSAAAADQADAARDAVQLSRLDELAAEVAALAAVVAQPAPIVTDEQLEAALRKVLGSVDGSSPPAQG